MKRTLILAIMVITYVQNKAQSNELLIGADLIVFNAKITTGSLSKPQASAVAVKRGRIYALGTDSEILKFKDNATKLIDAGGKRMIPGINDAHIHILNDRSYNYNVRWEGVPTLKRALAMLSEQAKRTPEGQWVKVIGGWSPYQFKEKRLPTIEEIRKAVPNRPAIVQYAYNRAFLNEMAMKAFGVGTNRFPALPGTVFEKDQKGNYTGVVDGYTFTFISLEAMVPQPSNDEQLSSITNVINSLNRFGVTSAVDGASLVGHPHGHTQIQQLAKENRLNVRMPFIDLQYGDSTNESLVDAEIKAVTMTAPISPGENMHPTMAHGHEYEGAGELLRVELHDHENFDRPAVIIDKEIMRRYIREDITKLVEKGIPFRMHISYDENITPFLDELEEINRKMPFDGLRWSIEHAETISLENAARVKKLGGGIALDTKMAMHGDAFIKTYGAEKASQTPRLRELYDSGVPLTMTTDAFRVASFNPWIGISWMITGKSVSGSEVLAKNNRLTREEALKLFTVAPTWFEDQEREMGKIIPGYLADFVLLNKDFFTIPDDEIKTISSVLTVVDGRVVFGADDFSDLSPKLPETLPTWSPFKYYGGFYNEK
ncbi:amidohydrolase [Chryseobacterium shandongense]|uniref:Amidohydrolase n=1 Tax=Chryseobacterium shandongense TaxID=1493872 RepID=A0AAD1DL21_9FLAO|nr:amidohydrolase [Chryseobacterium shandongense]AZA85475.1 amidohydrolase [Chryseobacterium shandongense]AZA97582.1 amidohydrolase [Chryseobacterium shandongense]